MAIPVEKLNGEPIILITVDDNADKDDVIQAYLQSVEMTGIIPGPVYRIIEFQEASLSYQLVIATIQDMVKGLAGAAVDPQMAAAFVGTPEMMEQSGKLDVLFFTHFEEALAHARAQVAEEVVT